jgi:hypothetical protein
MGPTRALSIAVLFLGCGASAADPQTPASAAAAFGPSLSTPSSPSQPAPGRRLTRDEARRFMVQLINRDRASAGLAPVELDDSAATRAGQSHADDMATHGYLAHLGTDGSVPEQRFTEAGGADMVMENASCFVDGKTRRLDPSASIDPKNVEASEGMFFHEKPPHDGHRKNILTPWHKKVAIGIAQPFATATEIPVPCITQEFVDAFGTYAPLPRAMRVGDVVHVEGAVDPPAKFAGVGLARVEAPKPIPVPTLNGSGSYPIPTPYESLWPPGYQTPLPVRVTGNRFAVDAPLTFHGEPGMYEVSVWATVPGSPDFVMVSLRTIQVLPR